MKLETMALIIILAVMNINYAVAGGRHGHHYGSHGYQYKNHYRGHRHHYNNHYRGRSYYSYGPRRYYRYYDNHEYYAAYALGGLIVGGVLGSTLSNSYYNGTQTNVNPTSSNVVQPSYVLQPNGICYAVSSIDNGNLVLSPVSPGYCQ